MDLNIGILFIVVELIFIDLSLLAMVRVGYLRLNSSIGIARDSFPPGKMAQVPLHHNEPSEVI